jgi:hypothetical protein
VFVRGSVYTRRYGGKKALLRKIALYLDFNHPSRGEGRKVAVVTVQVV